MTTTQIKKQLKEHKISQKAFAERCLTSPFQISRWLNGKVKPTQIAVLGMELMLDIMIKEKTK